MSFWADTGSPCWAVLAVAVSLIGCFGCGPSVWELEVKEDQYPLMEQAKIKKRGGDIDGAISLYEKVLQEDPAIAKAHLEAALLYDQKKEDFILAIHHYQRYLALRPNAEKKELIGELVRLAKLSYAASLPDKPSEAIQEIARLQLEISNLRKDLAASRKEASDLRKKVKPIREKIVPPNATPTPLVERPVVPRKTPAGERNPPGTYTVKAGDSLYKIAFELYRDKAKWEKIYNANRDILSKPHDLRVGQVLKIPMLNEGS